MARYSSARLGQEQGIALLLVVFLITLGSITVLALSSATYTSSRIHRSIEQQFRAEYLLKSGLNVARAIIATDKDDKDPFDKSWGLFRNGVTVPGNVFGITEPGVSLSLEIRSEEAKLSLRQLKDISGGVTGTPGHTLFLKWREIFGRLFHNLGFDEDQEVVLDGPFKGRKFSSQELVANLIDYVDADSESYSGEGGFARGIEGELPKGSFPNVDIEKVDDLIQVPGFTSNRIRKVASHLTAVTKAQVNVNFASVPVLMALDEGLDRVGAERIIQHREKEGPFDANTFNSVLSSLMPSFSDIKDSFISYRTLYLQVISKVQFGNQRFFLRAYVVKPRSGDASLPKVVSYEVIG